MPISKERKKLYPKNWKEIREKRLEKCHNQCELCNVMNHEYIIRRKDDNRFFIYCSKEFPLPNYNKPVKVVLTLHHINNDPTDNRDCNLLALCQRCHNKLDAPFRADKRKENNGKSKII